MDSQAERDLAKQQLDRGELDAAIETCNRVLLREPGDTDLLFWRGIALMRKGDYGPAAEDFCYVLEKFPDHNDTLYNRGYCLRRSGKYQEALPDFQMLLQRQPDDVGALVQRGRCFLDAKDPQGALNDFERALQLKPDYAEASFLRAWALGDLAKWLSAVEEFDRTVQLDPNYVDAYFQRAWAKSKLNNLYGAIDDYSTYIKQAPNDPQGYTYRGYCHRDLSSYDKAIEDFEKAIALDANRKGSLDADVAKARQLWDAQQQGVGRADPFWKSFAFLGRIMTRLEYSGSFVIALMGVAVGLPLFFAVMAIRNTFRITDPFIDLRGFAIFVGGLSVIALGAVVVRVGGWSRERQRVRQAILRHLGLTADESGTNKAQEQIRALVRCRGLVVRGKLAGFKGKLWLCFLRHRLLLVSVSSGRVLELKAEDLQKIHLVDRQSRGRFQIAIETPGGTSILGVGRLDDLVRIVNVLKENGVVLGYHDRGKRSLVPVAVAGLLVIGVAVAIMKPELLSGILRNEFSQHRVVLLEEPGTAALRPDGTSVAVRNWGNKLSFQHLPFDTQPPSRIPSHPVRDNKTSAAVKEEQAPHDLVLAFCFSGDGARSAIVGEKGRIRIMDSDGKEDRVLQDTAVIPESVTLNHNGRHITWASRENGIKVIEVDNGRELLKIPGERFFAPAVFNRSGFLLAFIADRRVIVWDLQAGREMYRLSPRLDKDDHGPSASGLAFSPDDALLAVGGYRKIDVYDMGTGQELFAVKLKNAENINVLAFKPDGNRLAAATQNQIVIVDVAPTKAWQVLDDREIQRLHGHDGHIYSMHYDADGRRLYSASATQAIRWE